MYPKGLLMQASVWREGVDRSSESLSFSLEFCHFPLQTLVFLNFPDVMNLRRNKKSKINRVRIAISSYSPYLDFWWWRCGWGGPYGYADVRPTSVGPVVRCGTDAVEREPGLAHHGSRHWRVTSLCSRRIARLVGVPFSLAVIAKRVPATGPLTPSQS